MDITGWTIAQRLRLPDYMFGQRYMTGVHLSSNVVGYKWSIGILPFPDPACVWTIVIVSMPDAGAKGYIRLGLRSTVPTSQAEMNTASEICPYAWWISGGPNIFELQSGQYALIQYKIRKGLATGGKKLVAEMCNSNAIRMRVHLDLIVSGLPSAIDGFLAHSVV